MRVYVFPGDMWGCGHYRMAWPAVGVQRLAPAGMDVELVPPTDRQIKLDVDQAGQVHREHFPADADVIVFQRPTSWYVVQAIPLLQARGVAVVVDMDDDLAHIDPRNPAWMVHQPTVRAPDGRVMRNAHGYAHAAQACQLADLVTVSTPALSQTYAPHGRVQVLYNAVPAAYLDVPRADSNRIGWPGALHSHPNDLQVMGSAISRLADEGFSFEVVGDSTGVGRVLGMRDDPPCCGVVELGNWPDAVGRLGIGVSPLADSRFNRAKSWLKPLEMSAVGVPWVASPRPEYARWHAISGGGLLADKPKVWKAALRHLATDATLRADLGAAGREAAREHTIEGNAWRWAEAWAKAYANFHARSPAEV